MDDFLNFFVTMPNWMKAAWVVIVLSFFWILEGNYKSVNLSYNKWKHAKSNLILLFFVMLINLVFGLITTGVFIWLENSNFGLLHLFQAPVWLKLVLSIMVLDLIAQYYVHYLLHKVHWMWRLHTVHHTDKNVDVTTGTRHHPFDFIIREIFALIGVIIMGMPISFYLFYRILTVAFTYFNHANIGIPDKVDRALSLVIVTPGMHKFHHHYKAPWTDSNYGNMLSIWDRIFGTFIYEDVNDIKYGLDICDFRDDEDLGQQLNMPFDKEIWRKYKKDR